MASGPSRFALARLIRESHRYGSQFSPVSFNSVAISLMSPFWYPSVAMEKRFPYPSRWIYRFSTFKQKAWKVETVTSSACLLVNNSATRSFISFAALFVNVTARMCRGSIPCCIMLAIRWMMTRVLPDPAPAKSKTGPSNVSTAVCCCLFKAMMFPPCPFDNDFS